MSYIGAQVQTALAIFFVKSRPNKTDVTLFDAIRGAGRHGSNVV